jgi:hypothetical protein
VEANKMVKKKNDSLIGRAFMILLVLLTLTYFLSAQTFDLVFKWVDQFRDGENIELKAQVNADSLTFLRGQETNIDSAAFDQLLKSNESKTSLQFKMINRKELVLEYQVEEKLRLEEKFEDNQPVGWKKVEFVEIQSYPLETWPQFIHEAVNHGLMEYKHIDIEGITYATFTFKQKAPSIIKSGQKSLKLTDEFYTYMKIPKDYQPHMLNSNQLVILVHEPHWLRVGQYQLIPGLKALIDSNSNYKFRFLVEGGFEEETKYIPTQPTLSILRDDVSRHVQVYSLLKHFIIDGPFAYRLLYDPDLPAVAIDDNNAVAATPREPQIERSKEREIFKRVYTKLEKIPQEQRKSALNTLTLLHYYSNADSQDLKGQDIVDYFRSLTQIHTSLSVELKSLEGQDFSGECSDLKSMADDYNTLIEGYEKALIRDSTMASNINEHFRSKYSERIPIVFIGSFHTPGIIERLDSGISYVVIEPRISMDVVSPSEKEQKNFDDALKSGSRLNYLKNLAGRLKLNVAPTQRELLPYCRDILKKEINQAQQREKEFKASSPLSPETTSRIINILEQNGSFSGISASFVDQGAPPMKPPIDGAFAAFSIDPDSENPKLFIYDRNEENWNRPDRLKYLKIAFIFPLIEEYKKNTRKADFNQDENSNRVFCKIFDPETQAFYFYDTSEGMDIYRWLVHPYPMYEPKDGRENEKEVDSEKRMTADENKGDEEKNTKDMKGKKGDQRDQIIDEKKEQEIKEKERKDLQKEVAGEGKIKKLFLFFIRFRISFLRPPALTEKKVYG